MWGSVETKLHQKCTWRNLLDGVCIYDMGNCTVPMWLNVIMKQGRGGWVTVGPPMKHSKGVVAS